MAGFITPTWCFHWFNKWVQSISLIHQSNFTDSQWKTYSWCHQWIITANQWPFTDSDLESKINCERFRIFKRIIMKNCKIGKKVNTCEFANEMWKLNRWQYCGIEKWKDKKWSRYSKIITSNHNGSKFA